MHAGKEPPLQPEIVRQGHKMGAKALEVLEPSAITEVSGRSKSSFTPGAKWECHQHLGVDASTTPRAPAVR